MRKLMLAIATFLLSGCTAMMVGGENTGGYQPPADECAGQEQSNERCNSD
ncbi:MAG: hypothetical protein OER97_10890 [Gammaproteobacteria bacterium]|nr:hypothetical protein [Gammaproteobacteria bacterium]